MFIHGAIKKIKKTTKIMSCLAYSYSAGIVLLELK